MFQSILVTQKYIPGKTETPLGKHVHRTFSDPDRKVRAWFYSAWRVTYRDQGLPVLTLPSSQDTGIFLTGFSSVTLVIMTST